VVLDVDPRNGGDKSFGELVETLGFEVFEALPQVITPRGGFHLYYAMPDFVELGTVLNIMPGIDVIAHNYHVVAPPSRTTSGRWTWRSGENEELTPFPKPLLVLVQSLSHRLGLGQGSRQSTALDTDQPILRGKRNTTMNRRAGSMKRAGFPTEVILTALRQLNSLRCKLPLEDREVQDIARSSANWKANFDPVQYIRMWAPRVKGNAFRLAAFLACIAKANATCTPANAFIGTGTGLEPRAICRAASELQDCGAITRSFRGTVQKRQATLYKLLAPKS